MVSPKTGHEADCGAKYALQSVLRVYMLSILKLKQTRRIMRYVYFYSKNRDKAEDAMEDAFAYGEISWADEPKIEKRGAFWCLTLIDKNMA